MSGFRVASGGAQELYGIAPDLTTFGKIIGGGLPVGAYGGRREIMEMIAPSGPVYQAGTLSGNPLAMTAGIETLKAIDEEPGFLQKAVGVLRISLRRYSKKHRKARPEFYAQYLRVDVHAVFHGRKRNGFRLGKNIGHGGFHKVFQRDAGKRHLPSAVAVRSLFRLRRGFHR